MSERTKLVIHIDNVVAWRLTIAGYTPDEIAARVKERAEQIRTEAEDEFAETPEAEMNAEEAIAYLSRMPGSVNSFEAAAATLREQEAEVRRLREALAAIKGLVCGEQVPNWRDRDATTTTRGRIADICDIS